MYVFTSASADTTTECDSSLAIVLLATTALSDVATVTVTSSQAAASPRYSHESAHSTPATHVKRVPTSTMPTEQPVGAQLGDGVGADAGSTEGDAVGARLGTEVVGDAVVGSGLGGNVYETSKVALSEAQCFLCA